MRWLLLRYQRELTVLAAALIATGGFAVAAFVSEGSQAVGAGTYVVRSDASGLLVTGEVVDVRTDVQGRTVTVVRWHMGQGQTVTRALRAEPPSLVIRTITRPGETVTQPASTVRSMQTMHETQTVTNTETFVSTEVLTETVVVTETVNPPQTDTGGPSEAP
jgi:hypothetical protein